MLWHSVHTISKKCNQNHSISSRKITCQPNVKKCKFQFNLLKSFKSAAKQKCFGDLGNFSKEIVYLSLL